MSPYTIEIQGSVGRLAREVETWGYEVFIVVKKEGGLVIDEKEYSSRNEFPTESAATEELHMSINLFVEQYQIQMAEHGTVKIKNLQSEHLH